MARNQVVTIFRMFWLIVMVGRVLEAEEHVRTSLRSLSLVIMFFMWVTWEVIEKICDHV